MTGNNSSSPVTHMYKYSSSVCFSSVAVNTSIYQSSCAAVFLFAIPLLGESISIIKVCSHVYIMYSIVGNTCIMDLPLSSFVSHCFSPLDCIT